MSLTTDSRLPDSWVIDACAKNPPSELPDDKGQPSGIFLTGTCRLAFANLLEPVDADSDIDGGKYAATFLFPPCVNLGVLGQALMARMQQAFPEYGPNFDGLEIPLKSQNTKLKYAGYTQGGWYLKAKTDYRPSVVNTAQTALTTAEQVYSGAWVIGAIKFYTYSPKAGRPAMKRGVGATLLSVMVIADDNRLNGVVNPAAIFKGVSPVSPIVAPDASAWGAAMAAPGAGSPLTGLLPTGLGAPAPAAPGPKAPPALPGRHIPF